MERELYFDIDMSVNENQLCITKLEIKTSPWARQELSPFLQQYYPPKSWLTIAFKQCVTHKLR
jgi:hypothetical protein